MGLWMNIFHLDICVRLTEEWGWLCWQWSWIVENNLLWHFDLLLRAKRHRLLLTNLGWHLNIDMMTWHEDVIWWHDDVRTWWCDTTIRRWHNHRHSSSLWLVCKILSSQILTNFLPILTNFDHFIIITCLHSPSLVVGLQDSFFTSSVTWWQTYK